MAIKTANQKFLQKWFISSVIGLACILEASVCFVMFCTTCIVKEPFGPAINVCYKAKIKDENENELFVGPLVVLCVMVFALVIGIVYDLAMLRFLRNRRRPTNPEIALIPLHNQPPLISPGSNDSDSAKVTIPIQATAFGVVNLCIMSVFTYVLVFGLGQKENQSYFLQIAGTLCVCSHMPLVLFLTVKSNEKKIPRPVVIRTNTLHFHDEASN